MADIPEEPSPPPVVLNGAKAHCKVNGSSLKEKTPMCLVNELARYNQIPHQYRLTHEDGPAHKKVFTVTLKLGRCYLTSASVIMLSTNSSDFIKVIIIMSILLNEVTFFSTCSSYI